MMSLLSDEVSLGRPVDTSLDLHFVAPLGCIALIRAALHLGLTLDPARCNS
jgi:hypothetical protein